MKDISTPDKVREALNLPPTPEIKPPINVIKPKKKYNYTKKTGRPPITLNDLPKNWKEIVYNGSLDGKTEAEIRRDICIARGKNVSQLVGTWYALKEREPEFLETLNICSVYRRAWWEEQGRKCLTKKFWQGYTWFAIMKNCFGYQDRVEVEHDASDKLLDEYKHMTARELVDYTRRLAKEILDAQPGIGGGAQKALPQPDRVL